MINQCFTHIIPVDIPKIVSEVHSYSLQSHDHPIHIHYHSTIFVLPTVFYTPHAQPPPLLPAARHLWECPPSLAQTAPPSARHLTKHLKPTRTRSGRENGTTTSQGPRETHAAEKHAEQLL